MCDHKQVNNRLRGDSRFINSFLNNDVHPCKKPKLDVSLSQTSVTRISRKSQVVIEKGSVDAKSDLSKFSEKDLWGDDLDESEVNECFTVASQAISQDISIKEPLQNDNLYGISHQKPPNISNSVNNNNNINNNNYNIKTTPSTSSIKQNHKTGIPLFRASSAGNLPDNSPRTSGYASLSTSGGPQKLSGDGASVFLLSEFNKYKDECRILREKLQTKDGEVSLLRACLDKTKSEQKRRSTDWSEQLRQIKAENVKKINDLEKQITELKTGLQFKSMELNALEEKLKKSRDFGAATSSDFHAASSSKKSITDFNTSNYFDDQEFTEIDSCELLCDFGNVTLSVNQGSLLAKTLEEHVYYPSSPECHRSNTSKVLLFNKHHKTEEPSEVDAISNCFLPLTSLFKCESFFSYSAKSQIKKIIDECVKSFNRLIEKMDCNGPQGQLVDRSIELLQISHTLLPLTETYSLLQAKKLYPEEKGTEARRMLGLIEALVSVSNEAAEIIVPEFCKNNCSNVFSDNSTSKNLCKEQERQHISEQFCEKSSILHVIRNLVSLIACERRTLQYNGILAGVATFLSTLIEKHLDLTEAGQKLFLEIIKHLLTSCPGPTVILYTCQCLHSANYYSHITNNLCLNTVSKNEGEYAWCYTFSKDTCPVTVLCYIVQAMGQTKRYLVADVLTKWFLDLLTRYDRSFLPYWLNFHHSNGSDSNKDCACPWNLSKVVSTLLCEAALLYDSERNKLDIEDKLVLERLIERGLLLFNKMLQRVNFGLQLGEIEGRYELFIHILSMLEPGLPLRFFEKKVMEDMIMQEAIKEPIRKKCLEDNDDISASIFKI